MLSSLSAQLAGLSGQNQPTNRRREDAIGRGISHSTQVGYSLHAPSSKYKPSVLYDDARAASDVPLTTLRENALSSLSQLTRVTGSDAFVSKDYVGLLAGKTSVGWERRVSSKSDVAQRDKLCERLLGLLCTVWGEDENSAVINQARTVSDISGGVTAFAAGLHVLEYLLRLYSVHLHLPQAVVLCVLPAHETPLFNRVLQLIDLAEMPSYVFLRPFAAPGAETLPRGAIAKKAAGDDALVASLCKLARDAARIHSIDVPSSVTSTGKKEVGMGPVQPRQGVSRVISFAAAVLVEALDIQTTAVTSAGSAKEPTLRVILPYVLGACCGSDKEKGAKKNSEGKASLSIICPDFRSWGYVMASALIAKCPAIAPEVREVIATTISKGALEMSVSLGHGPQSIGGIGLEEEMPVGVGTASVEAVEEMTTSMLALISVLSGRSSEEMGQLASLARVSNAGNSKNRDLIGLNMPASTFRPLARLFHLTPAACGEIMDTQGIDVTDALASLFLRSFEHVIPSSTEKISKKGAKKVDVKRGEAFRLILAMVKEPSLKDVWKSRSNGLTASVASHIVVSFASPPFDSNDADSEGSVFLDNCRLLLREVRSIDAVGCDGGIAHAVALLKGGKKKRKKEIARRVELLIGSQAPASTNPTGESSNSVPLDQDGGRNSISADDEFACLLPARVALEHPDASVRLHAVKRLLDDVEMAASTEADDVHSLSFDSGDAIDVCRSLLRRFLADNDSGVAAAAAGTIRRLIAEDIVREEDIFGDAESIQSVIGGLLKWSVLDDIPSRSSLLLDASAGEYVPTVCDNFADKLESQPPSDPIEAMCCALALAGLAASTLLNAIDDEDVYSLAIESEGEVLRVLLIFICAHLDITSDGLDEEECINACELIHNAAAFALIHAISEDKEEQSDSICDIQEKASQLICENETCLAVLLRTCSGYDPSSTDGERADVDDNMERRYMWACLFCMSKELLGSEQQVIGNNLAQNVLTVIHHILGGSGVNGDLTDREAAALLGHLVPCFASIISHNPTMLPAALIDLCASASLIAYDKVSRPVILYLFGSTSIDTDEEDVSGVTSNLSSVAILLEAASRYGVEEIAVTRLVNIACACMSKENILSHQEGTTNGLVQALSLLSHSSQLVRASAIEFIGKLSTLQSKKLPTICARLSDTIESFKSSLMMDGGALPNFLAEAVAESNASNANKARNDLLKHCVVAAIGTTSNVDEGFSFGDYLGGSFSAHKIFEAMEEAGESAFPLSEKWNKAGKPLFDAFLSPDLDAFSDRCADVEMHPIKTLCVTVVVMLKGIVSPGNSGPSVVISTGPAKSGRRARSYSVGTGDDGGLVMIDPYPNTMTLALSSLFSCAEERIDDPYVRLTYNAVAQCILRSPTWGVRIFPKLKVDARRTILSALLKLRSEHAIESAGSALGDLQIADSDMTYLFETESASNPLALTCVTDAIRNRAATLASSSSVLNLSTILFDKLADLSRALSSDVGSEYVRISVLQALISLHGEMAKQNIHVSLPKKKSSRKKGGRARSQSEAAVEKFAEQATLLVSLVGSDEATTGVSGIRPVRSSRGSALVLSLLTTLCSQAPGAVVGSLIPALGNILSPSFTGNEMNSLAASQALRAIVPAYCVHAAAAGFSFAELVDAFIASCYTNNTGPLQCSELCTSFADALVAVEMTRGHGLAIASFVGSLVAADAALLYLPQKSSDENGMDLDNNEAPMEEDSADAVALSIEVLGRASTTNQVVASLQIVQYIGQMIEHLLGTSELTAPASLNSSPAKQGGGPALSYAITTHGLCEKAAPGGERGETDKKALISLTMNLLCVVRDLFSFSSIKKVIKNNEEKSLNNVCLSLWQELVQLQSNALRHQAMVFVGARSNDTELLRDEKEFWEGIPGAAEECLDLLQRVLPIPDYLASVTDLLQDDDTEAPLFVRTAELLSERAAEIDPYSHEATLFLEVVPELVTLLLSRSGTAGGEEDRASRHQVTIKQASLMAIERLAQALCLATGDERVFKKASSVLMPAMREVTALITSQATNLVNLIDISTSPRIELNDGEIQLLSTAALCASTLVAVLRARCLPLLSKLVKPVISSLTSINSWLKKCSDSSSTDNITRHTKSANLSQLALLRTLVSVAETLPQFAVPYLGTLFAPSALPSRMLRSDVREDAVLVANMTERLDRALAKRTPARQIIPAASKAVAMCLYEGESDVVDADAAGWQEAKALLSILKSSVDCTSRAELTPVVGKLLNAILIAFKYDAAAEDDGKQELLTAANETLLTLVLKLSEAQLRPLYARIREWRGDPDETNTEGDDAAVAATKRYAFWSMSALLSKELRSIFLPCLSSVLPDAITELEFAAKSLCKPNLFSKKEDGKKRHRLGKSEEGTCNSSAFKSLQPILLCLELSLKADAHEGGNWIRGDDGQRHALILEPLGKLLHAKLPPDMPVITNVGESKSMAITSYANIIQGIGTLDYGSVSRCIVALAMAAGDERMWKPINQALLQACENNDRPEVRRAGVHCLKSVMESIGEEYMVLLPECLPALSELLEDEDEMIAGLARECITLGEELLGESLQESLR